MNPKNKIFKKGFSLIELLVVISMIGMLSSIVLASTVNIKEKARVASALQFSAMTYHALGSNVVSSFGGFDSSSWNENSISDISGNSSGLVLYSKPSNGSLRKIQDSPVSNFSSGTGSGSNGISAYSLDFINGGYLSTGSTEISIPANDITFSLWIKQISDAPDKDSNLIIIGDDYNNQIFIDANNSNLSGYHCERGGVGGDLDYVLISVPTIGVWHNITCTMSVSTGKISFYVDGKLSQSASISSSNMVSMTLKHLYIGGSPFGNNPDAKFPGYINNVMIYGQAFSERQVYELYAEGLKSHDLAVE